MVLSMKIWAMGVTVPADELNSVAKGGSFTSLMAISKVPSGLTRTELTRSDVPPPVLKVWTGRFTPGQFLILAVSNT